MEIWRRVKAIFKRKQLDRDLEDEMAFHLAMREEKKRAQGVPAVEARYAARRELGNSTRIKEMCREMWSFVSLETFWRDLRYGARSLTKNPGFTLVAVLAVALGIGVNTGVFSVLNGVALKLLPVPKADQIVSVDQIFHGKVSRNVHGEPGLFSYPEYLTYRDNNHVFSSLLAYEPFLEATLGGETPKQLMGASASCNYFEVLREQPQLGRVFVDEDCNAPAASPVVVISDDLWRSQFGADPAIAGKTISLNHAKFIVIGVAARGFAGLDPWPCDFWAPVTIQKALEPNRDFLNQSNTGWLGLLGRMQPGVSLDEARSDLGVIAGRIDEQYSGRITSLVVHRASFMGRPEERTVVFAIGGVVLAAVGLVLLIACANVANLLLARASARQKEIAIRLSIGGSRWRIVRQLLTESLLIAFLGGTLGSLLAFWSMKGIAQYVLTHLPHGSPRLLWDVSPDLRVWGYSLAMTVMTGVVFGLAPALQATRPDLTTAIRGDGEGSTGKAAGGGMLRGTLVAMQVAVCMILLIAAGLLMRGLYFAQTVDPGFDMKDVASMFMNLGAQGYDEGRGADFIRLTHERLAAVPGVVEVAQAECAPLSHDFSADGGWTVPSRPDKYLIEYSHVSPGYLSLVGIPIVRGRDFTQAEARNDATEIIVTESTARRLWPGQDPIGKFLREGSGRQDTVVGIAADAQISHLGEPDRSYLYFPAGPRDSLRTYVLVRYSGDYGATAKAMREAVKSLDADLPVEVVRLEDYLEGWRTPSRIVAVLSGTLGALALLLASIGVYGVVSFSVSRRVREIGIRMALGADGRVLVRFLLGQALRPVLIGALIGIAGCAAVSQVLSSVLYGIGSHDPIAFIGVPVFLLGVAFLASYIPVRRATRVDPVVALRYE